MSAIPLGSPLTAPAVSPATIRRWKRSTRIITGTVTTTAAAAMSPIGVVNCEAPGNWAIAAGTVCAAVVDVSEIANTKSFQQMMNTMMKVVTMPGIASGTITFLNAWNGVAPSTCAACSSSHGISLKNADKIQIDKGSANVMYGMISPGQVSYRPIWRHRL